MKTGPKNQLYARLLSKNHHAQPKPPKPWRQLTSLERSRLKGVRTLWRRRKHKDKLLKFGKWVASLRKSMKLSQREFAVTVGVSITTIKRWEYALGYQPRSWHLKKLKELAKR